MSNENRKLWRVDELRLDGPEGTATERLEAALEALEEDGYYPAQIVPVLNSTMYKVLITARDAASAPPVAPDMEEETQLPGDPVTVSKLTTRLVAETTKLLESDGPVELTSACQTVVQGVLDEAERVDLGRIASDITEVMRVHTKETECAGEGRCPYLVALAVLRKCVREYKVSSTVWS